MVATTDPDGGDVVEAEVVEWIGSDGVHQALLR
jgi:hypothetical protein